MSSTRRWPWPVEPTRAERGIERGYLEPLPSTVTLPMWLVPLW
jgi:hypothetical protein